MASREDRENKELQDLYSKWCSELKRNYPELFTDEYSNPYYISIPQKWFDDEQRILIVGEQGFGYSGSGKDEGYTADQISNIQKWNTKEYIERMVSSDSDEHPFWTRAREVDKTGWSVAWTFLDKISLRNDRRSKMKDAERNKLHSVSINLLEEEIRILQPTHVFLFGWFGDALKAEMPVLYDEIYPNGKWDDSVWENFFGTVELDGVKYILTYSPYSPYWKEQPENYENAVIEKFVTTLSGVKDNKAREKERQRIVASANKKPSNEVKNNEVTKKGLVMSAAEAKQSYAMKGLKKSLGIIIIVWIAVSFVILCADVTFGSIMLGLILLLGPMELFVYYNRLHGVMDGRIQAEPNRTAVNGVRTTGQTNRSGNSNIGNILDNPVVGAAASYTMGKAVVDSSKKTKAYQNMSKNPNTERYKEAHENANNNRLSKQVPLTRKQCATCKYWQGERSIKGRGSSACVQLPGNDKAAGCGRIAGSKKTSGNSCNKWQGL